MGPVKRVRVESDSEPETPAWKEDDFFRGPQCFKIGNLRVRLFFQNVKFCWMIFFKKKLLFNEASASGMRESRFCIPLTDVEFVASSIRTIVQDLLLGSPGGTGSRDLYKDTPESYKTPEFWNKSFCFRSESKSIILRGYCDSAGSLSVRLLTPKVSTIAPEWMGNSATIPLLHALEFAELITSMREYAMKVEEEYQQKVTASSSITDIVGFVRESPTEADLIKMNKGMDISISGSGPSVADYATFQTEDEEKAARIADDQLAQMHAGENIP